MSRIFPYCGGIFAQTLDRVKTVSVHCVVQGEGKGPAGGLELPGTVAHRQQRRSCGREVSSATRATLPTDQEQEGSEERDCFYCLEGWVFLGSLDYDGEEIVEAIRCRRCGGARQMRIS